jgi:dTDP-4-dehydrorhamnose 3,5-epimerase
LEFEVVIERLAIPDVWTFKPRRFEDARGWFEETFNARTLQDALPGLTFVQDNQALSRETGTLRGLHFQKPPRAQDKLVRVLRGAILDVAVDIRNSSPTFGKWVSADISAENGLQIFIPKGFAHGYVTTQPDTEVLYKVSDFYSAEHEMGVVWNDPSIGVDWRVTPDAIITAEKDLNWPRLAELPALFSRAGGGER